MTQKRNGNYQIIFSKKASKDKQKLKEAGLDKNARQILNLMMADPFCYPPTYEKLVGDLLGHYSRRINRQHRIIYSVDEEKREIHILRMWTHYE